MDTLQELAERLEQCRTEITHAAPLAGINRSLRDIGEIALELRTLSAGPSRPVESFECPYDGGCRKEGGCEPTRRLCQLELYGLKKDGSRPVEAQTQHGVGLISAERTRQKSVEGWSADHDNKHDAGEIAMAAACYATPIPIRGELPVVCNCRSAECTHSGPFPPREWRDPWPWSKEWDKRGKHGRVRQLVIAGALIAAEIDRLIRAGEAVPAPPADTVIHKTACCFMCHCSQTLPESLQQCGCSCHWSDRKTAPPATTYFDGAAARRELEAMGDAAIVGKKPPADTPATACDECGGDGLSTDQEPDAVMPCEACNGTGKAAPDSPVIPDSSQTVADTKDDKTPDHFANANKMVDTREREMELALRNCRMLAQREIRNHEGGGQKPTGVKTFAAWKHILRFCEEGVTGSILRVDADTPSDKEKA